MIIKALSLWQPWAEGIRIGAKTIETRHWMTTYTGWLGIHAAKKKIDKSDQGFCDFAEYWVGDFSKLDFGAMICVVTLSTCRPTEVVRNEIGEDEELWGNYGNSRWAWMLDSGPVIDINPSIPVKGNQGLFNWQVPQTVADRITKWGANPYGR